MSKLNILFNTSPGAFKDAGGGEIQLLETKSELEKAGHSVTILEKENYKVNFSDFDLFHNFNIHRDNYNYVIKAKNAGLPVAISTIYWPSLKHALLWNRGIVSKTKAVASEGLKRLDFFRLDKVAKILGNADVLLPNSKAESAVLQTQFGIEEKKIHVVPNGVEKRFANAAPGLFNQKFGLRDFVLYVGRVEERKNVIGLVKALKKTGQKLVVIGNATSKSKTYYEKCVNEAAADTVFIESIPHNSKMLEAAYAACKVFALPSWYETPGLAALEAGLAGANVVVTNEGCTGEYFGKHVLYANPSSIDDIRVKILAAMNKPKSRDLSNHIEKNFLWKNAAIETINAYESIKRLE